MKPAPTTAASPSNSRPVSHACKRADAWRPSKLIAVSATTTIKAHQALENSPSLSKELM